MKRPDIEKMRACAPWLPEPGPLVVAELCEYIHHLEARLVPIPETPEEARARRGAAAEYRPHWGYTQGFIDGAEYEAAHQGKDK